MSEDQNTNPNPLIPGVQRINTVSRNFLVNNRQTLRPVERVLRLDPQTSRELDVRGGFTQVLTRGSDEILERDYLSSFIGMQTSLYIDRVTNGDILNTPTLETMYQSSRENNSILVSVATELNSCCEEIKLKLDSLYSLITGKFRPLRDFLILNFNTVNQNGKDYFDKLTLTDLETRQVLLDQLNSRLNTLQTLIDQTSIFIRMEVTERSDRIENLIRSTFNHLTNQIISSTREMIDKSVDLSIDLKRYIEDSFTAQLFNIESALSTQTESIISGGEAFYTLTILPVLTGIAGGVGELVASTTYISGTVAKILIKVETLPKTIESLLKDQLDDLKDYLNEWKKDLIREIAEEVSLQIVGESYYRWDSTSTYFPTLTFIFKEVEASQYPRRSQIKVRLKQRNEDLTDVDIKNLKRECNKLLNQSYTYGENRFNYVSTDKRFKTTVFGSSLEEVRNLFINLFSVLGEQFEERNLSITSNRGRLNVTKRNASLFDIECNTIDYKTSFPLKLSKAVLLVNGLSRPIVLLQS